MNRLCRWTLNLLYPLVVDVAQEWLNLDQYLAGPIVPGWASSNEAGVMVYSPLPNCLPSPPVNGQLDTINRPWPRQSPCPGIVVLLCIRTGNGVVRCRRRSGPTATPSLANVPC